VYFPTRTLRLGIGSGWRWMGIRGAGRRFVCWLAKFTYLLTTYRHCANLRDRSWKSAKFVIRYMR